jgi:hypothetical protein
MSKVDQQRALGLAKQRRQERQRSPETIAKLRGAIEVSAPKARAKKPTEADDDIAIKRLAIPLEPEKKARGVSAAKQRQASRQGKKAVTVFVGADLHKEIKVRSADGETTVEDWVINAIEQKLGRA